MMRRRLALLTAAMLLVAAIIPPATGAASPNHHLEPPNAVIVWNVHATDALFNLPTAAIPGAGQPPNVGVLHLAMVQGAVYDAVNSIDRGHRPYLRGLPRAPWWASKKAAVATAAHDVLVGLVPALPQPIRDRIGALYSDFLEGINNGPRKEAGIAAGAAAAKAMLADRAGRRSVCTVRVGGGRRSR